jgi:hypothetical protein
MNNSLMRSRYPRWKQFGSRIRDGKKSDPGSGFKIPDPQHRLFISVADPSLFGVHPDPRIHASDLNTILSAFLLFEGIFTSLFKDKKVKRVTK